MVHSCELFVLPALLKMQPDDRNPCQMRYLGMIFEMQTVPDSVLQKIWTHSTGVCTIKAEAERQMEHKVRSRERRCLVLTDLNLAGDASRRRGLHLKRDARDGVSDITIDDYRAGNGDGLLIPRLGAIICSIRLKAGI